MDENLSWIDEIRVRLPGNEGRCTKQSSKRKSKSKKRTFHGNRYSKSSTLKSSSKVVNNAETVSSGTITRSEWKIHNILPKEPERTIEGYRLFDMVIFKDIIKSLGCLNCKQSTLYVDEIDTKRKGCASYIIIKCFQCTYTMGKYTSQSFDNVNKKQRIKNFDVT